MAGPSNVLVQLVQGTITIGGTPTVAIGGGTFSVSNFPGTQPISGAVSIAGTMPVQGTLAVSNFPGTFAVNNFPALQTMSVSGTPSIVGTVAVSSVPVLANQTVTPIGTASVIGTVAVSSVPVLANQSVTVIGAAAIANQSVTVIGFNAIDSITTTQLPAALGATGGLKTEQYISAVNTRVSALALAPGVAATIVDTGSLTAGTYMLEYGLAALDTVAAGKGMIIEVRDAANTSTTFRLGGCVAGVSSNGVVFRLPLATSQRIRVIGGSISAGASSQYIAHLGVYPAT